MFVFTFVLILSMEWGGSVKAFRKDNRFTDEIALRGKMPSKEAINAVGGL
jgi:hypothetical protein